MKDGIYESKRESMKEGNKLLDVNWRVDLEIENEKGKKNEGMLVM